MKIDIFDLVERNGNGYESQFISLDQEYMHIQGVRVKGFDIEIDLLTEGVQLMTTLTIKEHKGMVYLTCTPPSKLSS